MWGHLAGADAAGDRDAACGRRSERTGSPQPARHGSMLGDRRAAVRAPLRTAPAGCTPARTARRSDVRGAFRCATPDLAARLGRRPPPQGALQRYAQRRTRAASGRRPGRPHPHGEPVQSLAAPDVIYTVALRERGDFTDLMGRAAWHQMPKASMLSKSRVARDRIGGLFYCLHCGDRHVALYVHIRIGF